jgi:hypothetical protein
VPHYQARRFYSGNAIDDGISLAEFVTPTRAASIEADFSVPALQSWLCGMALLVGTFPLAFHFTWPWYTPLAAGAIGFVVAWFRLLGDSRKSLFSTERLERSQPVAAAAVEPASQRTIKLKVEEDARHIKYAHLPLPYEDLRAMARATLNGRAFSLSSWAGNGKLLSRSQFETLRDWLLTADYAGWLDDKNHAQGIAFNSKGKAFWRALAS